MQVWAPNSWESLKFEAEMQNSKLTYVAKITAYAHLWLENHNSFAYVPSTVLSMYHLQFCICTVYVSAYVPSSFLSMFRLQFYLCTVYGSVKAIFCMSARTSSALALTLTPRRGEHLTMWTPANIMPPASSPMKAVSPTNPNCLGWVS